MPEVYTNRLLIGTQGHMISRKNPPISPVFYDVLCPNETGRVLCLPTQSVSRLKVDLGVQTWSRT